MREVDPIAARPRTADEVAGLPPCPDVLDAARCRGVQSIVHFTTVSGAIGIFASGAVKSRSRLQEDQYLEHVYRPNAPFRKDENWLDYVSLSIARINDWMFVHSKRWHVADNNPWVLFSFDLEILSHPGVVFATTNNIYPACRRAEGRAGFERLFAQSVYGRYDEQHERTDNVRSDWPTDRQAEVLYAGEVPCSWLRRVDVQLAETMEAICGALAVFKWDVSVRHTPEVFK